MTVCRYSHRPPLGTYAGVHDHDVNRPLREISIRAVNDQGRFKNIVGLDAMCDVNQLDVRRYSQDHSFHHPHKGIRKAEVRC